MEKNKGIIFNIQHFSVHDGPGIRDVVFLKGCPLRCAWCSNPESHLFMPQVAYGVRKCLGDMICGACIRACPAGALRTAEDHHILREAALCTQCHACAKVCPTQAMHVFGERVTVDEVIERTADRMAGVHIDGGVTLSGGEPLAQAEFAVSLLAAYQRRGIHTAIETCGFVPWRTLDQAAVFCDLIFMDLKMITSDLHKRWTGVDNQQILINLYRLSEEHPNVELRVRTPLIPKVNDSREELEKITEFLRTLHHLDDYELLPYHALGNGKYQELGVDYTLDELEAPSRKKTLQLNNELRRSLGLPEQAE